MSLVQMHLQEIAARMIYLKDRLTYCRAGGYMNWLKEKVILESLHDNYGLPGVGGYIYWEDGTITYSSSCIYCGAKHE